MSDQAMEVGVRTNNLSLAWAVCGRLLNSLMVIDLESPMLKKALTELDLYTEE